MQLSIYRLLCCVVTPVAVGRPSLVSVFSTNVTLSYDRPENIPTNNSTVIIYTVKYRKYGCKEGWEGQKETSCHICTLHALKANTLYQFTVTARHESGEESPDSPYITLRTENTVTGKRSACIKCNNYYVLCTSSTVFMHVASLV